MKKIVLFLCFVAGGVIFLAFSPYGDKASAKTEQKEVSDKNVKEIYIQPETIINHVSIINDYEFLEISYQGHQYLSYARHLIHAQHCPCFTKQIGDDL